MLLTSWLAYSLLHWPRKTKVFQIGGMREEIELSLGVSSRSFQRIWIQEHVLKQWHFTVNLPDPFRNRNGYTLNIVSIRLAKSSRWNLSFEERQSGLEEKVVKMPEAYSPAVAGVRFMLHST